MANPVTHSKPSSGERLSRIVVAVTTCLGGLGLFALLYFPLKYLK
jgi:hypothetical protein